MREKIFKEIQYNNVHANGLWRFQHYNVFYAMLPDVEKEAFNNEIDKLCDEGILISEDYMLNTKNYRLTESGERVIYGN